MLVEIERILIHVLVLGGFFHVVLGSAIHHFLRHGLGQLALLIHDVLDGFLLIGTQIEAGLHRRQFHFRLRFHHAAHYLAHHIGLVSLGFGDGGIRASRAGNTELVFRLLNVGFALVEFSPERFVAVEDFLGGLEHIGVRRNSLHRRGVINHQGAGADQQRGSHKNTSREYKRFIHKVMGLSAGIMPSRWTKCLI